MTPSGPGLLSFQRRWLARALQTASAWTLILGGSGETWLAKDGDLSCDAVDGYESISLLQQRSRALARATAPSLDSSPQRAVAAASADEAPWALIEKEAGVQVRQEDAEALRESASALAKSTKVLRDYDALRTEDARIRDADAELRLEDLELRRQNSALQAQAQRQRRAAEPGAPTNSHAILGFVVVIGVTVVACAAFMCFEMHFMYEKARTPPVQTGMSEEERARDFEQRTLTLELQLEWLSSTGRLILILSAIGAAGFLLIWWMGIAAAFMPQLLAYLYFGVLLLSCLGVIVFKLWESLALPAKERYSDLQVFPKPLMKVRGKVDGLNTEGQKGKGLSDRVRDENWNKLSGSVFLSRG